MAVAYCLLLIGVNQYINEALGLQVKQELLEAIADIEQQLVAFEPSHTDIQPGQHCR